MHTFRDRGRARRRRGSVLVEFALIALVLYLILAATIELGRALFGAQVLQQATDVLARELSRTPLPAAGHYLVNNTNPSDPNAVINSARVKGEIFDDQWLVVPLPLPNDQRPVDFFADKPIVNQLLLPLMIVDTRLDGTQVLRYPGLVPDGTQPDGYRREIPVVTYAQGSGPFDGTETIIRYVPVIEEIQSPAPGATVPSSNPTDESPFNLAARNVAKAKRGLVAVRINYPFQSAMLSATAPNPRSTDRDTRFDPNLHFVSTGGDLGPGDGRPHADLGVGPYGGSDGLGQQLVAGRSVRPFRRLISAQAIYRREVFGPSIPPPAP